MSCCNGLGLVRFRYRSGEPDEFGVCLCTVGQLMRDETNAGKKTGYALWQVWAYRNQVNPERIGMLEEFLDELELSAMFPNRTVAAAVDGNAIAAAMRTGKGPRL